MRYLREVILATSTLFTAALADPVITSYPDALTLSESFDPIKAAYWTGLPHHRRTPFSISPDGQSAYLAYLDSTYANVVVQQVDVSTFEAVGTPYSTVGYEAAGLVAQNDGFALLATVNATGTTDLPTDDAPIVALIRVQSGTETWRTPLNGPGVHEDAGLSCTPDANGDLVYSSASGLYAAYFVVEAYSGDASGHFGDSIQYVNENGTLETTAYSSTFGCSHNTGIGFEAADEAPFASICADDQGEIWLNTNTQYMSGVKISNENTTNGCSGEPMGGMSGSYSNLARFPDTTKYIFAWQSRGAMNLKENSWMGDGYTTCDPRWLVHNVAISTMSAKDTLTGSEATSVVGTVDGDSQINWITNSSTVDHQNVHAAAFSSNLSVITWETLNDPDCQPLPLECSGTYAGTSFQVVDSTGAKIGDATVSTDVFVSGDIVTVNETTVCWPYVDMTWDLSTPVSSGSLVSKMSFACASIGSDSSSSSSSASGSAIAETSALTSTAAAVSTVKSASSVPVASSSAPASVVVSSAAAAAASASVTSAPAALSTSQASEASAAVSQTDIVSSPVAASSVTAVRSSAKSSIVAAETSATSSAAAVDTVALSSSAVSSVAAVSIPTNTVTVTATGKACKRKRSEVFVA